ncbi:sugar-binding transcriptional regulator [Microbacterium sp. NIBRBAC000506063]|uniref:sugar-binding transcriptional regulator n=1 Tax=Microbacterium sp. NIBRBAC000506063 TaxID=2734618 RepID=UPI001BB5326F|nr:sugar-binding domain-containing protein [Microbacterium sp. NIBRBAC000506063]QTV80125.1 hypothetical protein KAE78_03370 [Microbacterium sp. NIBRBAC000506063]
MSALNRELDSERGLTAAVARAHYLEDRSRVEIAEMFEISRFKVARLLTRAREEGIVTIGIHDGGLPDPVLATRLGERLGLRRCEVIRSHGDDDNVRTQVGYAAASLLSETLVPDEVLGVAWGRTLTATASQLEYLPPVSIVQLTGVVSNDIASSPIEVARQASRTSGGKVYPIFAPLFVEDRDVAASLRSHPDIRAAIDLFPAVTTALLSIGAWNPRDTQIREAMPPDVLEVAESGGYVADIAGILLKADGTPVDPNFQDRCINIHFDQLLAIPRIVCVAAGASKAEAVLAISRAGLLTELVADHVLAEAIFATDDA